MPCCGSFEVHTCNHACCPQELLDEIQQQPGVFVLSGRAVAIINGGTASEFLDDGWSTEFASCVVRTERTKQENTRTEPARHVLCSCKRDEMATFDVFPSTVHELEEDENPTEKIEPEDDQDDETEQSLSDSLQIR